MANASEQVCTPVCSRPNFHMRHREREMRWVARAVRGDFHRPDVLRIPRCCAAFPSHCCVALFRRASAPRFSVAGSSCCCTALLCRGFAQRVSVRRWLRRAAALRFCATPSLSRRSFASRYAALCAALMRRTVCCAFRSRCRAAPVPSHCGVTLSRHAFRRDLASRGCAALLHRGFALRYPVGSRFCAALLRRADVRCRCAEILRRAVALFSSRCCAVPTVAPRALRRAFASCLLVGFALLRHASFFSRAVASR